MKLKLFILALSINILYAYPDNHSKLVTTGDNKLIYSPYTDKGDIIPDFSYCGYMGGGVEIPNIKVVATICSPNGGDDFPVIQALIDSLSRLPLNENGFRGAILLKKGIYKISETIRIKAGGIVLRGEGNSVNGTVLLATSKRQYNVIELGVDAKPVYSKNSEKQISDDYVPSGTKILHVENAERYFKKGDAVIVRRPSTANWIHDIGMDSIPPRPLKNENTNDSYQRFRKFGTATEQNGTVQWKPGSKDLLFERTIINVSNDVITLDIPLTNALQKKYGGATISRYTFPERISQCGIENIYGMSVYNPAVKSNNKFVGEYYSDEQHANNFVFCKAIENAWIKDVSVEHFDCCVWTSQFSKFITGQDLSAVNPISVITGGRRYSYSVWGQMCLFQRCYANGHRHVFVLGASVAGPNAFVDGRGEMSFSSSEPHQRWAAGCLYDNIVISGYDASFLAVNRSWYGSGHGWAGAQIIFWNCSAPVIMAMKPPTAQNFIIGSSGKIEDSWSEDTKRKTINAINDVSRSNFTDKGVAAVGDAWIEHPDQEVSPKSLYYEQLKARLGTESIKQVMTARQINSFFPNLTLSEESLIDYDQKMKWWRDAKFGMFIHWGVYSIYGGVYKGHNQKKGGVEWIMNRCKIPVDEYKKTAETFNPIYYDAEEWVKIAQRAGMKYIVITAKHHDGFAMFKSKASDFNIVDYTPFKRDAIAELAAACRKYGMKLGFYYSQSQDWCNAGGATARKLMNEGWDNPDSARINNFTLENKGAWDSIQFSKTFDEYLDEVAIPQIHEILSNYGDVSVVFWDTPMGITDQQAQKIQNIVKKFPQLITNDRLKRPNFPGDYKTPEGRVPKAEDVNGVDWETCMNIGSSWGYKSWENAWKPAETLIRNMITIAARGGNYLLNVGPDATGLIPNEAVNRLAAIGDWLAINGEAVYGTIPSLFTSNWGEITRKDLEDNSVLYFCVFNYPRDGKLTFETSYNIKRVSLLSNGDEISFSKSYNSLTLEVPKNIPDSIATVIKVELKEKLPRLARISNSQKYFEIVDEK